MVPERGQEDEKEDKLRSESKNSKKEGIASKDGESIGINSFISQDLWRTWVVL